MSPSLISGWPSCASSEQTRTSQAIASSRPPPRQKPWIAAIDGLRAPSSRSPTETSRDGVPSGDSEITSRSFGNSLMSAPATNARSPPPRSTIAPTSSSPSSRSISAVSSSSSGAESGFIGGLLIVTTATRPSTSVAT